MAWATHTFVTPADLAKVEEEINRLVGVGTDTYTATAVDISDDTDPIVEDVTSIDVSDSKGISVIIGEAKTSLIIADGETLTIKLYDSADDATFTNINNGLVIWERTASGSNIEIAAGTELFRYIVPATAEDYVKAQISSSADNSGTIDIYCQSMWTNKIALGKQFMGEDIEKYLQSIGYGTWLDYENDEELKDMITNLDIFNEANLYLVLSLIYEDLCISESDNDQYKFKADRYRNRYQTRLNMLFSLKNISLGADGETDIYKDQEQPTTRIYR